MITFNIPTNQANYELGTIFNCNELFKFQDGDSSIEMSLYECVWMTDTQVRLSLNSDSISNIFSSSSNSAVERQPP